MTNYFHMDAAESAFFERQLEYVKAQTYDIKYADLKARMMVPVSTEANAGATSVTYEQWDEVGLAKIISANAKDVPRVDVKGEEFTRPVRLLGAAYGWTVQDVKAAAMAGTNLNTRRAAACRRAIERLLDEIAAIGAPLFGIATGCLNNASVTIDPSAGSWTTPATPDTIISEIAAMWQGIIDDSEGVETADTLVLPDQEWAHIAVTPRSATSDTTIMQFVRNSFPDLRAIEPWHRLKTAGAGSVRRAWMYSRRADILAQEITNDFEQLPVQEQGMEFVVHCMAATAGTAVYYPIGMRYLDGI